MPTTCLVKQSSIAGAVGLTYAGRDLFRGNTEQQPKQAADLTSLAPKWKDRQHIMVALRQHLQDTQQALDTDDEQKELTDLALITDAYRRSQVGRQLLRQRMAKFRQYASSPSLADQPASHVKQAISRAAFWAKKPRILKDIASMVVPGVYKGEAHTCVGGARKIRDILESRGVPATWSLIFKGKKGVPTGFHAIARSGAGGRTISDYGLPRGGSRKLTFQKRPHFNPGAGSREVKVGAHKQAAETLDDVQDKGLRKELQRALSDYEGVSDPAHGRPHVENVVAAARRLNQTAGLDNDRLLAASVLHDIGNLSGDRKRHAEVGAQTARPYLEGQDLPSRRAILHAIRQHRYTGGKPRTALAKLVNDADTISDFEVADDPNYFFRRAMAYNKAHGTTENAASSETLDYARTWLDRALSGGLRRPQTLEAYGERLRDAQALSNDPERWQSTIDPIVEQLYKQDKGTQMDDQLTKIATDLCLLGPTRAERYSPRGESPDQLWARRYTEKQAVASRLLTGGWNITKGLGRMLGRGASSGLGITRGQNARAIRKAFGTGRNKNVYKSVLRAADQAGVKGPSLINPLNWLTPINTMSARFSPAGKARWLAQQQGGNTRAWKRIGAKMKGNSLEQANKLMTNTQIKAPAGVLWGRGGQMGIQESINRTRPRALPYTAASFAVYDPAMNAVTSAVSPGRPPNIDSGAQGYAQ